MNNNTNPHPLSSQQGYIGVKNTADKLADSTLLSHVLDEIACGVIITDAQGHLLHCNLAGRLQLERSQCLRMVDGRVQPVLPADDSMVSDALAKAMNGKRSMLSLGDQKQTAVAVVPLNRHAEQEFAHGMAQPSLSAPTPQKRIAFIFSRTGMCEALMMSFFARAYHLTRSEEQILGMLCTGLTAPEMAQQLRVGEATVRTHIRNVCVKTECNGIREVVKRLALLPPLMAAVMPSAFA